jgi:hypothetical protein
MDKVRCSICQDRDAKIVMLPHWKTGLIQPFVEGTCGHPECVKEYEQALEYGYQEARQEAEERMYEEVVNEDRN